VHTPLSLLVLSGDRDAILDSFKANQCDKFGRTVAHYCADKGQIDILQEMVGQCDNSIDVPDNKGRPPLHYAVTKGYTETVDYMIGQANCSLKSQDAQGYHPLTWACQFGRTDVAKVLLTCAGEKGELKNILELPDKFSWRAIHKAAEAGSLDIVKLLVEKYEIDATQPLKDNDQRTPLALATSTGATSVIEYLSTLPPSPAIPLGTMKA